MATPGRAHLVRSGSSANGTNESRITTLQSRSALVPVPATALIRTQSGCIDHRRRDGSMGVGGGIRTMASAGKSKTKKRGGRRGRKGKHGGTQNDNDANSSIGAAPRRKQAARDRLRGVMKSYRAMIDDYNNDTGDEQVAKSSHEGDGGGHVPPTQFLAATASPNAWIASAAADASGVDRALLFANPGGGPPRSFRSARFEYCPPKSFGHELPEFSIPEVAFLGRSNVGKSSLINAITGRRELARVSKRPGRTQQVNYFALLGGGGGGGRGGGNNPSGPAGKRARGASSSPSSSSASTGPSFHPSEAYAFLIDLPGFGYAAAPDQAVDDWQRTTMDFLLRRRDHGTMVRVYLLVDGRHGATPLDLSVMDWFDEAELPYTVVLTKTDSSSASSGVVLRHVNDLCMRFHGRLHGGGGGGGGGDGDDGGGVFQGPVVHLTSAKRGDGIEDLMWAIDGDFVGYYEEAGEGATREVVDSGKPRW